MEASAAEAIAAASHEAPDAHLAVQVALAARRAIAQLVMFQVHTLVTTLVSPFKERIVIELIGQR